MYAGMKALTAKMGESVVSLTQTVPSEPIMPQIPSVPALSAAIDIVVSGNMYNSEVETPRNDGSVGVYLKYTPNIGFEAVSNLIIENIKKDLEFLICSLAAPHIIRSLRTIQTLILSLTK